MCEFCGVSPGGTLSPRGCVSTEDVCPGEWGLSGCVLGCVCVCLCVCVQGVCVSMGYTPLPGPRGTYFSDPEADTSPPPVDRRNGTHL